MENYKNIEDLFNDQLKNLEVKPTEKVWKGVRSNLWYSDIQNVFRNYTIQPANAVWRNIAFLLWFKTFLTFSPRVFNVYYLLSICVAGFSVFYSLNQTPKTGYKISDAVLPHINFEVSNKATSQSSILINYQNASDNSNKKIEEEALIANTLIAKPNNADQSKVNNSNFHEPILIDDENENENVIIDKSNFLLLNRRPFKLNSEFSNENFITRNVTDFNAKKWHWSIEVFVMPMTSNATYKVNSDEYSGFNKNYSTNQIPANTFSEGMLAQVSHMNFSFQAGLSFCEFKDKPGYQVSDFSFDTTLVTQIIPGGYFNYYTVHILDLDWYLLYGDSLWIDVIDSTFISTNDTVLQQQVIAHTSTAQKQARNSYSYVELPLMAGYTFSQGKINMTVRGGLIVGMLTSAGGEIPSPYSEFGTTEIVQNVICRKFMLSGIAGLEIAYDATKHLSIVAAPVYRFNLSSVYKRSYVVDQRFRSFGVKFGLRYNF